MSRRKNLKSLTQLTDKTGSLVLSFLERKDLGIEPKTPGVYVIAIQQRKIIRASGKTDSRGILDIGMSETCLRDRIWAFIRCAKGENASHAAGQRYAERCSSIRGYERHFPSRRLLVWWDYVPHARKRELELIGEYVGKYYELPPLNHSE